MSRFVSSGTISSTGEADNKSPAEPTTSTTASGSSNPEWERVQKELDAERARRSEARRRAVEGEEKSLYDVLQANKAAKEAAFEEQNRLRNQFKALDEDDVEFLDEVRAKKKREEDKLRQETEEGLKVFRERQKGETGEGGESKSDEKPAEEESWAFERRRKRKRDRHDKEGGGGGGLKKGFRGRGGAGKDVEVEKKGVEPVERSQEEKDEKEAEQAPVKSLSAKPALGLVDYGSDDSD